MGIPCLFLILWTLLGGIYSETSTSFCINQLGSIPVEVGGNITIPCSFSYPKNLDNATKIRVYWREGDKNLCRYSTSIYKHTEDWIHERYRGRISMVGNPEEENTASIRIQGVDRKDGPVLCCMLEVISDEEGIEKCKDISLDHNGTVLLFPDQTWVDQLDAVPALRGEDVTIPCSLHYSERRDPSTFVTWTKGRSATCPEYEKIHTWKPGETISQNNRFSLVNYPDDISLIIKGVNLSDMDYYCCEVVISRQSTKVSVHGTELVVEGAKSYTKHKVFQPQESFAYLGYSAMMNCSINSSKGCVPLWTGIYWRVGSLTGNYAYHPSQEMIHSSYRYRTSLAGQTNLYIVDVQRGDIGPYYCFVMLRFCKGQNKFKSIYIHGEGTKLNVEESSQKTIMIPIISSFGALFLVIILCGILFFLKKKGTICKKEKSTDEKGPEKCDAPPSVQPSSLNANSVYETVPEMETKEVDVSGVVYSQLNVDSLNKGRTISKTKSHSLEDPEILYSDVKTPQ